MAFWGSSSAGRATGIRACMSRVRIPSSPNTTWMRSSVGRAPPLALQPLGGDCGFESHRIQNKGDCAVSSDMAQAHNQNN